MGSEKTAFAPIKEMITDALSRLSDWRIDQDGWTAMASGLRRVYKEGYRACTLAQENPSVGNLHEWRKQATYLWRQLQLLEMARTKHEKNLSDQVHKLSQVLGDDHDLAVLRQTLAADPLSFGGRRDLKGLIALIDRQRRKLERQAFALGGKLYKDSPKVFIKRITGHFNLG
jgi:CHAD domain-containing protein